ncbi:MAG TPA: rhomboid family intramembrane serine protease [Myxococcaceae bacterium]|nr:rhomboid family intramembrane serine protease [Myxococcaceae bacterium]
MRPMRRGFRPLLPGLQGAAAWLAVALVGGSVVFALTRDGLGSLLLLVPGLVLRGDVWQPLTYGFVENSPMGVIFGALILWQLGGALEQTWGSRRMAFFAVGTTVLAGLFTVLLALGVSALRAIPFPGGFVMGSALWVAYGLSFGRRQTNFWGLPVSGNVFALIGVGFVFLSGAFSSFLYVIPSAVALLLTWAYLRLGGPSDWFLRLQSWRLQRQLRSRSKHLTLVSPDRNTPRDSDRFLQ